MADRARRLHRPSGEWGVLGFYHVGRPTILGNWRYIPQERILCLQIQAARCGLRAAIVITIVDRQEACYHDQVKNCLVRPISTHFQLGGLEDRCRIP
jgi:hypothetical protein